MHTYLKRGDDEYEVGQWLIGRDGYHKFEAMFTVPNLRQAWVAVNTLNGGTRINTESLNLVEKE